MKKVGEFDYVNRYYGLNIKRGTRLKFSDDKTAGQRAGKKGTVARGDGHQIYILVDGDLKPTGPFHPTSNILYETDIQSTEPEYPEHRKLEAVKDRSQSIGEFLEWLYNDKKLELGFFHKHGPDCEGWNEETEQIEATYETTCKDEHHHSPLMCSRVRISGCDLPQESMTPTRIDKIKLLAEFFGIDQNKLESEKDKMLDDLRKKNAVHA